MNSRLKELADTVAEILAKRWLKEEQQLQAQSPNPSTDPQPTTAGADQRGPTRKNAGTPM
jgi:hypothetical protein